MVECHKGPLGRFGLKLPITRPSKSRLPIFHERNYNSSSLVTRLVEVYQLEVSSY